MASVTSVAVSSENALTASATVSWVSELATSATVWLVRVGGGVVVGRSATELHFSDAGIVGVVGVVGAVNDVGGDGGWT